MSATGPCHGANNHVRLAQSTALVSELTRDGSLAGAHVVVLDGQRFVGVIAGRELEKCPPGTRVGDVVGCSVTQTGVCSREGAAPAEASGAKRRSPVFGPHGGEPLIEVKAVGGVGPDGGPEASVGAGVDAVLQNIGDAVFFDDCCGRVTYGNRAFYELFGIDPAAEVAIDDYVAPEWRAALRERHERRIRGEAVPARFEYEGVRSDGKRLWLEVSVTPVRFGGEMIGTQSVVRDITRRKALEAAARAAEAEVAAGRERIRGLIDGCAAFIGIMDIEGRMIDANAGALALGGHRREEVIGKLVWEVAWLCNSPQLADNLRRAVERARDGEAWRFENDGCAKDGSQLCVEVDFAPVRDGNGQIVGIVGHGRDVRDRRVADRQRRAERQLNDAILDQAGALVVVLDSEGRVERFNRAAEEIIGWSAESVAGRHPWNTFLPTDQAERIRLEAFVPFVADAQRERMEYTNEVVNTHGGRRLIEWVVTAMRAPDGSLEHVVAVGKDVTESARARRAVELSRVHLQAILDAEPECVKVLDEECRILEMNRAGLAMVGADTVDEVRGRSVLEFLPARYHAQYQADVRSVLRGERAMRCYQCVGHTGRELWLEQHSVGLHDPSAPGRGLVLAVSRDITDRMLAEERLRRSESRLLQAQRIALLGSWELDHTTGELLWSDSIYSIFELDRAAFRPSYEAFLQAVHPQDRERVREQFDASLRYNTTYDVMHRLLMSDGRIKHVHERCEHLYGPSGEPLRSVGTVQDVTDRVAVQAHITKANKREALAVLAGGIAHEFNSVLLAAAMHLQGVPRSSRSALRSVEKGVALIQQAQSMSAALLELFAGGDSVETPTLWLKDWLEPCVEKLSALLPGGAGINCRPGYRGRVCVDPLALEQVLRILITNALDAGADRVVVETSQVVLHGATDAVEISVSDNGPGVAVECQDRIFDPFFTTRNRSRRSGLGLAIAVRLVEHAGGTLTFRPAAPHGSVFVVKLQPHSEESP